MKAELILGDFVVVRLKRHAALHR